MSSAVLRIATRSSPLATWQAEDVARDLRFTLAERGETTAVELVFVDTLGDRTQALGTPLHQLGGQGVFVKEVQAAVLDGRADIAVHSAKDLPGQMAPGLVLAAVTRRDDVRDGLVGATLDSLREGAVIATGSVRRRAQLASVRPDLRFVELRGNMARRVARANDPDVDAVVVGCAGLDRLGLGDVITQRLDPSVMLPQVGQAAVAIECRADDASTRALLHQCGNPTLLDGLLVEREFLVRLGAGCQLPIGALMHIPQHPGSLDADSSPGTISGLIASLSGEVVLQSTIPGGPGSGTALAELLLSTGGQELLVGLSG